MVAANAPAQCVLTSCEPNPCQNGGECFVLENETISSENETIGVLCGCSGGWTGLYCERPPLAKSGLQNWWLIPFFFVIILIIFWIIIGVCWWKRRKFKRMASALPNGPHFVEQQERMNTDGVVKGGAFHLNQKNPILIFTIFFNRGRRLSWLIESECIESPRGAPTTRSFDSAWCFNRNSNCRFHVVQ